MLYKGEQGNFWEGKFGEIIIIIAKAIPKRPISLVTKKGGKLAW